MDNILEIITKKKVSFDSIPRIKSGDLNIYDDNLAQNNKFIYIQVTENSHILNITSIINNTDMRHITFILNVIKKLFDYDLFFSNIQAKNYYMYNNYCSNENKNKYYIII